MRRGRKPKPTISIETVEAALKLLETGEKDRAIYYLENLAIVEQLLNSPSLPNAEDIAGWVVQKIMVDLIVDNYNAMRALFNLQPVSNNETRTEALQSIIDSFQNKSNKYIESSLFYYRYVRVDLAISNTEISNLIPISTRQLRRYREQGVRHLRDELIHLEWQARKSQHKTVLQRSIPETRPILFERSTDLVTNTLKEKPFTPILITGGRGVGKTAYATLIAHQLIEDEAHDYKIDYVLWLDDVTQPQQISTKLQNLIYQGISQADWRDALPVRNLLLIVDNITIAQQDNQEWTKLFQDLRYARIIMCNSTLLPTSVLVHHIELADLSAEGAYKLVSQFDITNTLKRKILFRLLIK